MKDEISVIIPLHNKQRWVERTLKSVLNQSLLPAEILVVDDGSTDDGPAIVESLNHGLVRLVRQANQGVSGARNRGVAEARHEWLAFVDADDWWDKDFLEHCASLRRRHEGVLFGSNVFLGETGRTAFAREGVDPWIIADFAAAATNCEYPPVPNASCLVNKTALLTAGGFPVGVALGEDTDTWLRLSLAGRFVLGRTPMIHYEMGDCSSAVHRLDPVSSPDHPASLRTYRGVHRLAPTTRCQTFRRYAQFVLRQKVDIAMARGDWHEIARILYFHGAVGGISVYGHVLTKMVLRGWHQVRVKAAIGSRLKRLFKFGSSRLEPSRGPSGIDRK